MEARLISIATAIALLIQLSLTGALSAGAYRTRNFVVTAPDPAFARRVGDEAERFRKELAELWLGHELPTWQQPCPILVKIEPHAGGQTSFAFVPDGQGASRPIDWRMEVFGTPERILDSVLPHEVTHTIFATHFGRPLPRWADEGACTTVEHQSERIRSHQMLIDFLTNGRGIPFNHMFVMKQYPSDILPLYSQGHSLARFLIMQRGHRHFVNFIGEGMDREIPGHEPQTWNEVGQKYYGYEDLSDLQVQWLGWVKQGCPKLQAGATPDEAIVNSPLPAVDNPPATPVVAVAAAGGGDTAVQIPASESWYVRQSRTGGNALVQRPGQQTAPESGGHYLPGFLRQTENGLNPGANTIWR